jgi:hypothetical protein
MQLSRLLGLSVTDADRRHVGTVVDVRLATSGDPQHDPGSPHLFGILVSPRTASSYLGYERSGFGGPRLLAALLRWRHRGTFLATWPDIACIGPDAVELRRDYQAYSPVLPAPVASAD